MRGPSMGTVEDPYSAHFHRKSTGRNPGGARPVGGPRMSQPPASGFRHQPVMVDPVGDQLQIGAEGRVDIEHGPDANDRVSICGGE